jgi:hypothetical protein
MKLKKLVLLTAGVLVGAAVLATSVGTVRLTEAGLAVRASLPSKDPVQFGDMVWVLAGSGMLGTHLVGSSELPAETPTLVIVTAGHCQPCSEADRLWTSRVDREINGPIWIYGRTIDSANPLVQALDLNGVPYRVFSIDDAELFELTSGIRMVPVAVLYGADRRACAIIGPPTDPAIARCGHQSQDQRSTWLVQPPAVLAGSVVPIETLVTDASR